jgi:hypothetical protein
MADDVAIARPRGDPKGRRTPLTAIVARSPFLHWRLPAAALQPLVPEGAHHRLGAN